MHLPLTFKVMPSPTTSSVVDFDHSGIASVLKQNSLKLPLNQREYSWEKEHVLDLFNDLDNAIDEGKPHYFLGTIVVKAGAALEVVDGQQRLATTTILLAAFRDYLHELGESFEFTRIDIEQSFLTRIDRIEQLRVPRLTLNVDDNEFFRKRILSEPGSPDRNLEPSRSSHEKIINAAELAREVVERVSQGSSDKDILRKVNRWIEYLENNAKVILVIVPDDLNAYVMFETLNDRGLKTSQADLLKNYLFGESGDGLSEAQQKWSSMVSSLEILDDDDITMTYLRHFASTIFGATREKEVFEKIKKMTNGKTKALDFLGSLQRYAEDYAAMHTPSHAKWSGYNIKIKSEIMTLNELPAGLLKPLMLAVTHHFSKEEALKAFRAFPCWTIRFMIVGGGRSGTLESAYSNAAKEIIEGTTTTCDALFNKLKNVIPSDSQFKEAFAVAKMSKAKIARHILRALEATERENSYPEVAPVENTEIVNLEHILPKDRDVNWPDFDDETAAAYLYRIGNLALLGTVPNGYLNSESYAVKRPVLADCPIALTREIAEQYEEWTAEQINLRQAKLATLAIKTWPLLPS